MPTDPPVSLISSLDLARKVEASCGVIRAVRAHLRHGPHERTRRRLRRQLLRLREALEDAGRRALTRAGPHPFLSEALDLLEPELQAALYQPAKKSQWKALRAQTKALRKRLAAQDNDDDDAGPGSLRSGPSKVVDLPPGRGRTSSSRSAHSASA